MTSAILRIRMGGVSDSRADGSFVAEHNNAYVKKVPLLATFNAGVA